MSWSVARSATAVRLLRARPAYAGRSMLGRTPWLQFDGFVQRRRASRGRRSGLV